MGSNARPPSRDTSGVERQSGYNHADGGGGRAATGGGGSKEYSRQLKPDHHGVSER